MPGKPTLIVFGATSYTAQELLPYLDNHPDGDDFDFILAGRNKQKLDALNDKRPKRRQVAVCDSNDEDAVKALVEKGDVVINLAGPFRWHGGEHFIKHCAIAGKHYVDLSGESHWLAQDIIPKYDYLASKTGACIVPSCGFDSIPSDLTLYYALRTLQHSYPSARITSSISYFKLRGGVSGGTVATMKSLLEIPAKERAQGEWALLSSANGSTPSPQFVYKTPVPSDGGRQEKKIGSFFFMYPYNRCIVRRSWFLSRLDTGVVSSSRQASHDNDDEQDDEPRHGDGFEYREAMETGSTLKAMLISGASLLFGVLFFGFSLTRRLLLAFVLPSPGEGVDEEQRAKGSMFITNISNTTEEGLDVVSTCQGKGDPGYKITAFMLAESALALVLPPPKGTSLPPIGIRGGVLTPSAAMGMVLVERLQKSGTVLFESRLVGKPKRS